MRKNITLFFDLDGTLIDVSKRHYFLYVNECILLGIPFLSYFEYWKLKREKFNENKILQKTCNLSKTKINKSIKWRQQNIENSMIIRHDRLFPRCASTLKMLSKKYNLQIITSRTSPIKTKKQLEAFRILKFFNAINVFGNKKFQKCVRMIDIKSSIIIGDTEFDYFLAKRLTVPFIFASYGIRTRKTLQQIIGKKPNFSISKISDLSDSYIMKVVTNHLNLQ